MTPSRYVSTHDDRPTEPEVERFFYRSSTTSIATAIGSAPISCERRRGSKVVARIEPLGLVPASIGDEQLAIQRLRRNLVAAGTWQETPSGRHVRQRVVPARSSPHTKVAPQSS